ncbi:hypothetical protein [Microbacterium lushaniae]|uniref:Uncharacterized protein n=1 Tax=Microbacterium lushaniae TaxID=2614639 RepID=A0A5J6L629_9MICO|nr:hypothetical protein [Microbacterium lushaniae]QEW03877.1 hypothetical protein F6J85_12780 [Microbacterium lushaniae]
MNDIDFEQMLRESSPPVTTPMGMDAHQERILREAQTRRPRRGKRLLAAAGLSVLLIGGGSAALAGNGFQTPWGWMAENVFEVPLDNGSRCYQGMRIEYATGYSKDSPMARDAREILESIDVEALAANTSAKEAELREKLVAQEMSDADWKQEAVFDLVWDQLAAELVERGYSTDDAWPISLHGQRDQCRQ